MTRASLPSPGADAIDVPSLQLVTRRFRARMTPEIARLAKRSPAVARQFWPSPAEMDEFGGTEEPFEEGKLNHGIHGLERLYVDRAVLTPYFDCSAYCRYCFKKTRTLAGTAQEMSMDDIDRAIRFIESDPRIRIVLITGGDPLVRPDLLRAILDRAIELPHVRQIRIGSRNVLFQPDALDEAMADWLASYNRIDPENLSASKSLAIAVSVNHADELTPPVVRALRRLLTRGLVVRGQVTLLKGVNDDAETMRELYGVFATVGLSPYYLYHCMPVVGARHFRTSVRKGLDILSRLTHLTGAIAPSYVYVTPVGKHRLAPGVPLHHVDIDGRPHLRSVTPYRADDFFEFTGKSSLPPLHEVDDRGYIVSHYLDGED